MGRRVTSIKALSNEFKEALVGRMIIYIGGGAGDHACLKEGQTGVITEFNERSDNPYSVRNVETNKEAEIAEARRVMLLPEDCSEGNATTIEDLIEKMGKALKGRQLEMLESGNHLFPTGTVITITSLTGCRGENVVVADVKSKKHTGSMYGRRKVKLLPEGA